MSFAAPAFLWLLLLLPLLAGLFIANERRRKALLTKMVAARLQTNLANSVSMSKRRSRQALILLGLASTIVSIAQPRYGFIWEETHRKGRDVLIAIDTSKSMLSTDIAPDRLTRAKLAAQDLINLLPGDRAGLIAFAGGAFLQAPLTVDYGAVLNAINELDTKIIPRGGTDIASAIQVANEAFGKGESENRCLILFTDGEDLDPNTLEAAKRAAPTFKIFTVGIGSEEGSLIPVPGDNGGTSFVKDPKGQIVKSRLDESRLRQIAELTGGFYLHLGADPAAMKRIVTEGLESIQEKEIDAKQARKPIERYQWPLALGIFLLVTGFLINERVASSIARRTARAGATRALLLLLLALIGPSSFAADDGLSLFKQGKFNEAQNAFKKQLDQSPSSPERNYNLGTASYKLKDYPKALEAFGKAVLTKNPELKTKAEYNFGNTLFQQAGLLQEPKEKIAALKNAIQHYDSALQGNPQHDGAKANKGAAERWIKELEKQQEQQDQDKQKDKQQKDQDQKDQKENKDQKDQEKNQNQDKQDQKDQNEKKEDQDQQQNQKDQKDQQKQGEDKQDQKDSQKQDQSGQDQQQKDQGKQQDQPKSPEDSQDKKQQEQGQKDQDKQANPQPSPTPKPSGEIKEQDSDKQEPKQAQAAQPKPEKPGELSEQQAEALLQSLANEEARVLLNERRQDVPVLKDW